MKRDVLPIRGGDAPITSAEADDWQEICQNIRNGLKHQIARMHEMTPEGVLALINACDVQQANEAYCLVFDDAVAAQRTLLNRQAGGFPD